VPDVQDLDSSLSLQYAVNHTINVRLLTIEQVPALSVLRRDSAAPGKFFQTKNGVFETHVPAPGDIGAWRVDVVV
jgi:hypothetical protein